MACVPAAADHGTALKKTRFRPDTIYGAEFAKRVAALGIEEKPTAPHAPWQNPYAERLIGTIRR